jgi:hypothetical protein
MNPSKADLISCAYPRRLSFRWLVLVTAILFAIPGSAQTCNYTVTSLADSGAGTLRAGLADSAVTDICFGVQGTITLASQLQIVTPVTITGGSVTISGNNQFPIFVINPSSSTDAFRINGFTLTNGNGSTNNNTPYGGAVSVQRGNVTFVGTSITNSTASNGGGAIYNAGTLLLSQCGIRNNTVTGGSGGGIYNDEGGSLTLQGTTVSGNSTGTFSGGGLDNYGTAQIQGGIFSGNQGYEGGAIYNESGGQLPISQGTTFSNNSATFDGGAISNSGSTTMTQALFTGNQAAGPVEGTPMGGAFYNNGTATITESTFFGNTTSGDGGAIENPNYFNSLTLNDDTISGNSATFSGSGLDLGEGVSPTINNTIIAGNTAIAGAVNSDCNSCTITNGSVELGPLANNGGPTQTMMPLPGGVAIGAGDPTAAEAETIDQRGFSRLTNGVLDVGAVQTHYSSVSFVTQPSNTVVNQTITPAVAVQVIEIDGSATNYPMGVPVTVSLLDAQSNLAAGLTGTLTQSPTNNGGVIEAVFPDLSVNATGTYQLFATDAISGNSSSANPAYSATSNNFQIVVPVTLSWQPAPLTYGPMPQSELNAVATVNGAPGVGTYVYTFTATGATINVGQIYPVGTYQVQVAFTPSGSTATYTLGTAFQISQATPVLTWPAPAPIYTSTPLGSTQLDATATGVNGAALPGSFVYSPAAGTKLTAGQQALHTTFTPTDSVNYTTTTGTVTIQVNAVTAGTVSIQESANPITFGQSETFTAVVTGSDGQPFSGGTASFTIDGAAIGAAQIVNGSGSVIDATLTGGSHQVAVSYTNTPTEQTLTASTTLTVNKATPALTWLTPAPIYTSTALSATQLDAAATGVNGTALVGSFVYSPAAGTTLTAGSHVLATTFTPTDTTDYNTNTAQVTIQVNAPTAASVVIQESANPITYGQSETFTVVVTGTDGKPLSGGTATFTVDGAAIGSATVVNGLGSISNSTLTGGTHQVGVSYTNTTTNQTLTASAPLTVNKATPVLTWPTPAAIYTSTPLSATQLDAAATGVNGAALVGSFVYSPAAGTTLTTGSHVLATTFTPSDTTDYNTNTAQVTIQVSAPTAASVVIQESANPITFGKSETLTALVSGSDGKPYSSGTSSFTSDGTAIGSATVVNGSASISISSLTAGVHQIAVSYTNGSQSEPLTGSAPLTVNKATPLLAWPTPAPIFTVTPLSSTQLDATATGVNGATLAGTFVYNPAAGTTLSTGTQTLSTTFTPTDTTNYTTATAQVTIQVGYSTISIASVSPGTTQLGTTPLAITITGSGFTATSVAEINGSAIATRVQNPTSLTATVPIADLAKAATLNISVYDPTSKFSSNVVQFAVTAPAANITLSIQPTTGSGEQPTVTIGLNSPYPSDLQGTLALTFSPSGSSSVDDPAIQFSTGGRTLNFTVPADSTTTPQVALQTGTVAGTITVTLTLAAGGVDVTPAGLTPITLVIAPSAPVITSVTFTNNTEGLITVVVSGFSNTRDMDQAEFVFAGKDASHLHSSKVDVPATGLFGPWYSSSDSDQYGSAFTYTQNFQLSKPDTGITGVAVTLANSVGTSGSVNSQ